MFRIYKISEGETIEDIAQKFATTKEELEKINGIDSDTRASYGNLIIVPNNNRVFRNYQVKKGDTIYEIAQKYNVDTDALLKMNGLEADDYIYPDQTILIPRDDVMVYVTEEGDTLSDVASKMKTTKSKIVDDNDNLVLEDDQLIVYKRDNL